MRDTYGQLPPSELDMRRCVRRLLDREDLTREDLAIIGWCQRENHPILRRCAPCGGTGKYLTWFPSLGGKRVTCRDCGGTGVIAKPTD